MLESEVQKQLTEELTKRGFTVLRVNPTSLRLTTGQSVQSGIPDLLALKGCKIYFIEVKQNGKKPRKLQTRVMDLISTHTSAKCFTWDGTGNLDEELT